MKFNRLILPLLFLFIASVPVSATTIETQNLSPRLTEVEEAKLSLEAMKVDKALDDYEQALENSDAIYWLGLIPEDIYKNWLIRDMEPLKAENDLALATSKYDDLENSYRTTAILTIFQYDRNMALLDNLRSIADLATANVDRAEASYAIGQITLDDYLTTQLTEGDVLYELGEAEVVQSNLEIDLFLLFGEGYPTIVEAFLSQTFTLPEDTLIETLTDQRLSSDPSILYLSNEVQYASNTFAYAQSLFEEGDSLLLTAAVNLSTAEMNLQAAQNDFIMTTANLITTYDNNQRLLDYYDLKIDLYEQKMGLTLLAYEAGLINDLTLSNERIALANLIYSRQQVLYNQRVALLDLYNKLGLTM